MKIKIGLIVNGTRHITIEQAEVYRLIREAYADFFGVKPTDIYISFEVMEDKE